MRDLDARIIEKLKRGADELLESLWDFSDRQPHKMELNIKQLSDFNGRRIQVELDAMPGLEKLLRRRDIDAHRFLTTYFDLMARRRYTRMGLYLQGGTLECEAVVQDLFKDSLRQLKAAGRGDEETVAHTSRTWTSVTQPADKRTMVTARTAAGSAAANASAAAPVESQAASKAMDPVVASAVKTARRETARREAVKEEEDARTYVSVMPEDSISHVHRSGPPSRKTARLEGGLTKHALKQLQTSSTPVVPEVTDVSGDAPDDEEGFQEPAEVSRSAIQPSTSRGDLNNPSLRVARAPSVFPSSISLRTPSAATSHTSGAATRSVGHTSEGYEAAPPSTLRTHRPPRPDASSIWRKPGKKYFVKAVERAPDGSSVSRLEGGGTNFLHKSASRIKAGLQHAVGSSEEGQEKDEGYRFVEASSRVTSRTARTTS